MFKDRVTTLKKTLLGPVLIKDKQDLEYLLGREIIHGFLLVGKKSVFFGDGLEKLEGITTDRLSNITKYFLPLSSQRTPGSMTLGLDSEINLAEQAFLKQKLKGVKLVPIQRPLRDLRMIKDAVEISNIRKAQVLTGKVFLLVKEELKKREHTELSLARFIKIKGLELGADEVSFAPIVAAGKNAAVPHHSPTNAKLKSNQSIILDFGFKVNGYCSDFTRTVFLKIVPKKMEMYYNQTLKAFEAARDIAKVGIETKLLHQAAEKVLAEKNLDKLFIHSVGHGIGLNIHEAPGVGPFSTDVLEKGMVYTIEPGVYDKDVGGIRIEDIFELSNKKNMSGISYDLSSMLIK